MLRKLFCENYLCIFLFNGHLEINILVEQYAWCIIDWCWKLQHSQKHINCQSIQRGFLVLLPYCIIDIIYNLSNFDVKMHEKLSGRQTIPFPLWNDILLLCTKCLMCVSAILQNIVIDKVNVRKGYTIRHW